MNSDRDDVAGVIAEYSDALHPLIAGLEAQMIWNGAVADAIERGGSLRAVLTACDSGASALALSRALTEFERARFDMRVRVAGSLRALGMSNPEIAEVFGVSRQLVHRILADDRQLSDR